VVNVALYYICALVLTDVQHFSSVMYIIATYNSLHVLGHNFSGYNNVLYHVCLRLSYQPVTLHRFSKRWPNSHLLLGHRYENFWRPAELLKKPNNKQNTEEKHQISVKASDIQFTLYTINHHVITIPVDTKKLKNQSKLNNLII